MRTAGKKIVAILLTLTMTMFLFTGCGTDVEGAEENSSSSGNLAVQESAQTASEGEMPKVEWATEPVEGSAPEEVVDATVEFSEDEITVDQGGTDTGIKVQGTVLTIQKAGIYQIKGSLEDGQVVIDTQDEDTVKLILNGVKITNSDSAAVYVASAPKKVTLHIQKGSVNIVEDGADYAQDVVKEDEIKAAIFSKDDLKISGSGELYVTGNYNKGIYSKDDLEIKNAEVYVSAVDDAIRGKDSLTVESAYIYVEAGGDGLRTSNEAEEEKGQIAISDSEIYLTVSGDCVQAISELTVTNSTGVLNSGGGAKEAETKTGQPGSGDRGDRKGSEDKKDTDNTSAEDDGSEDSEDTTVSTKGMKAGTTLTLNGGNYTFDCKDDAIHCNDTVTVQNGTLYIAAGDDGIHADNVLTVENGNLAISQCYEGLEAQKIYYKGGTTRITAGDDGVNAAGGKDGSGMQGPGENPFEIDDDALIEISGGYLVVDASGDGLDSNGMLAMTGGTAIVYGPTNDGNGALDYNGDFEVSGDATLLAVGSSGMAQGITESEYGNLAFTCQVGADTIMSIQDSEGNIIFSFEAPKKYSCVVFTSPQIKSGEEYVVYTGGSYSKDSVDGVFTQGNYQGGTELGNLSAN